MPLVTIDLLDQCPEGHNVLFQPSEIHFLTKLKTYEIFSTLLSFIKRSLALKIRRKKNYSNYLKILMAFLCEEFQNNP